MRRVLLAVIAVAATVVAVTVGFVIGRDSDSGRSWSDVDYGFARDMATHHQQAITMAGYVRDRSTDVLVQSIAFDIETAQSIEMGQLVGWLQERNLSRNTESPMSWMGSGHAMHSMGALMPGMATGEQVAKLKALRGKPMDTLFLQLMLRHHQGGVQMASYAAAHASSDYLRTMATRMVEVQNREITVMRQMLSERNTAPLPAPA